MFLFFGWETCGILVSWPGIELTPSALEGEVLTTGLPGKYPETIFLTNSLQHIVFEATILFLRIYSWKTIMTKRAELATRKSMAVKMIKVKMRNDLKFKKELVK